VAVPFGHREAITIITGRRASGLTATALVHGPIIGAHFRANVEETLVPALRRGGKVVLADLPIRKVSEIRECNEAAGARLLHLLVRSPDLNPIRLAFQAQGLHARRGNPHRHGPLEHRPTCPEALLAK
jgi:hypothetical protein